jgi:hypothetical protein
MAMVAVREARISWRAPTADVNGGKLTSLAGYKIYYGKAPGAYTQTIPVNGAATVQYTVPLSPGTWYFGITALDAAGNESAPSNPVSRTIP